MSPLTLRRYRAERLLRQEFEGLRGRVIATVQARLGASASSLDRSDLDACYAQAWQGLYAAVLDGGEIANPTGWLTLVTYRRAIEELRARGAGTRVAPATEAAEEPDLAAELDDRTRLRHLFEGLRGRLSAREREAAAFCYLQGLSRSEAADRMGISQGRMRKLMDGQGAGRPGVAGKVGELAETIRMGGWCEEQGSLMRGLAYGILDPNGERYRLALIHHGECPACRAYVASLRGLAAVLPPVLLPWGLGAELLARASGAAHAGAGIGAHPGAQMGAGSGPGSGAQAVSEIGGAVSASGAAGVGGAAGGGWLLAGGPLSAKLAVGCVLALGVGAGCVALTEDHAHPHSPRHRHGLTAGSPPASKTGGSAPGLLSEGRLVAVGSLSNRTASPAGDSTLTPAQQAVREFGPEHGPAPGAAHSSFSLVRTTSTASSASSGSAPGAGSGAGPASPGAHEPPAYDSPAAPPHASAADREFGIG